MNAQVLTLWAGVLLSLIFSYAPKIAPWFDKQEATTKRLIMLGLLVGVAAGAMGLTCAGVTIAGVMLVCNQSGITDLATNVILAIIANQATYLISPKPKEDEVHTMTKSA